MIEIKIKGRAVENLQALTEWFWLNAERIPNKYRKKPNVSADNIISLIENCENLEIMRSFILFSILIDQFMYTHFPSSHEKFESKFQFPHVLTRPGTMLYPAFFIDDLDRKLNSNINWEIAVPIAKVILQDLLKWIKALPEGERQSPAEIKTRMKEEVEREFRGENARKVLDVIRKTGIFDRF